MQKMNLKKGLFGYTGESVLEYIVDIDNTYKRKMNEAANAQRLAQASLERLKDEVTARTDENQRLSEAMTQKEKLLEKAKENNESLSRTVEQLEEQNKKLADRISELEQMLEKAKSPTNKSHTPSLSDDGGVADVLYEARLFAGELKRKAQMEYIKTSSENLAKLELQKQRASEYAKRIDTLCGAVNSLCSTLSDELCELKISFEKAGRENSLEILESNQPADTPMPTVSERMKRLGF